MLTPYLPFPLFSGGQTRSYNLLKNLSKKHEITLFALIKEEKEKKYVQELNKFCRKVVVFKRSATPWTLRNIFLTGFSLYPFLVIRNFSPDEKKAIDSELMSEEYDLIHAETFYVMPHIPKTHIPILLVEQTIEYLVYKHFIGEQVPFFLRPILWIDLAKIRFWETYFWKRANSVVAMSEADKSEMQKLVPGLNVDTVPNGIDEEHFKIGKNGRPNSPTILYVGNFKWLQNREALSLLVNNLWPMVKRQIKTVKLWIVGMGITKEISELATGDVKVSEGIPDIRTAYENSDVLVAPIKGPGGTRLKIIEAMASGLPVVTTKVGMEGLDAIDGKHALISETEDGLVESTVKILEDKKLAEKIAKEARLLVTEKYTWRESAKELDSIYRKVAGKDGQD